MTEQPTAAQERAAIVAWLRSSGKLLKQVGEAAGIKSAAVASEIIMQAATNIQSGIHHNGEGK